jgi:hypothetical protein
MPLAQSLRASDVVCYSLDTESYAKEPSHLQEICDGDPVEICIIKSGGLGATTAFDLLALSPFLASFSTLSKAFWASFLAFSLAFLASLIL